MKIRAILVASLVALGGSAFAEPLRPIFGGALSPPEINDIVRSMGLVPTSRPVREGLSYGVLAIDRRGRQLRVMIDARFGDVLSVRRVMASGPPGAYPAPPVHGAGPPRLRAPYELPWMGPNFRPPARVGRADPYPPSPPKPPPQSRAMGPAGEKTEQKDAAVPASPAPAVVTIGPSAASRAADPKPDLKPDPKPTGSTAKAPAFPPAQTLE